jgi:hypothetical protein
MRNSPIEARAHIREATAGLVHARLPPALPLFHVPHRSTAFAIVKRSFGTRRASLLIPTCDFALRPIEVSKNVSTARAAGVHVLHGSKRRDVPPRQPSGSWAFFWQLEFKVTQ